MPNPAPPSATTPRVLAVLSTAIAMIGALLLLATPAAAAPAQQSTDGWVRLAHFSPDTPAVDVRLSAFGDNRLMLRLSDVAYGDISDYQRVPAGSYAASMLPPGSAPGTQPVVTQAVTVEPGRAYTVAAVGRNAQLTGTVLTDDLTPPASGRSRIRLVQASVSAPELTVQAAGGPVIADKARFGTATGYAEIGPGVWTVQLSAPSKPPVTDTVTVQPGTVTTLTVLDRDGAPAIEATVDSAGTGRAPAGGVQTGGGGTASGQDAPTGTGLAVLASGIVLAGGIAARRGARR